MLDVHPPHSSAHSWSDFFLHIATIVVGLLIAVGLEQTVEYLHHRHQRQELLESLRDDTAVCEQDGHNMAQYTKSLSEWLLDREQQIVAGLSSGHSLAELPAQPETPRPVILSYTHFQAAKASGLLQLLSDEDMDAFSDVNFDVELAYESVKATGDTRNARHAFEAGFRDPQSHRLNLSKATPAELREYVRLLENELNAVVAERGRSDEAAGASAAVLNGERGIRKLQQAEADAIKRDFGSTETLPGTPTSTAQ